MVCKTQVGNPDTEQTHFLVLKLGDWAELSHIGVRVLTLSVSEDGQGSSIQRMLQNLVFLISPETELYLDNKS